MSGSARAHPYPPQSGWAHLPPVGIVLVHDLEQVTRAEAQAGLFAGDEAVSGRVVVKVAFHEHLGQRGATGKVSGYTPDPPPQRLEGPWTRSWNPSTQYPCTLCREPTHPHAPADGSPQAH